MKKIVFLIAVCLSFVSCVSEEQKKAEYNIEKYIWSLHGENFYYHIKEIELVKTFENYSDYVQEQKDIIQFCEDKRESLLERIDTLLPYEEITNIDYTQSYWELFEYTISVQTQAETHLIDENNFKIAYLYSCEFDNHIDEGHRIYFVLDENMEINMIGNFYLFYYSSNLEN